ncbi:MAG: 4Fe-4S dicluster domain-containing protein [Thermoleophilia bacterium]|nr:4Fe-4S dicluster domain-containing protein [Thermoleophilia bacterium]
MERIVVDNTVCSGCRACELACVAYHEGGFGRALARIKVTKLETAGLDLPAVCRRCRRPSCAAACPTAALTRDNEAGLIRLDAAECIGCGACADACPFGMVTMHPDSGLPLICDLCDGSPACVKRCATGAIRFRDEDAGPRARREALARRKLEEGPPRGVKPAGRAWASGCATGSSSVLASTAGVTPHAAPGPHSAATPDTATPAATLDTATEGRQA